MVVVILVRHDVDSKPGLATTLGSLHIDTT